MKIPYMLLSTVLAVNSIQSAYPIDCKGCQSLKGLSPFWAQEYMGGDLAKALVAEHSRNSRPIVAVWDEGGTNESTFAEHGVKVENLIAGSGKQAISNPTSILEFRFSDSNPLTWVDQVLGKSSNAPSLVNLSAALSDDLALGLNALSERGSLIVLAAGNDFPAVHAFIPSYLLLKQKILVGSLSPFGLVSGFSEESSLVTILAPSDFYLTSALNPEKEGKFAGFNGTSGASPLVTGAIANVLTLLPGLNYESVLKLIQKTVIPTLANKQTSAKNGAGLINAYFMARVAERIAAECESSSSSVKCAANKIENDESYEFPNNPSLESLLDYTICTKLVSLELRISLRKEALLHPKESAVWERLSCAVRAEHLDIEADYYHQLALLTSVPYSKTVLEIRLQNLYVHASTSQYKVINHSQKISVLRALIQLGSRGVELANQKLLSSNPEERMIAIDVLTALGEQSLPALRMGLGDADPEVRALALSDAVQVGAASLPLLESIYQTESNVDFKVSLVQIACTFGNASIPFLMTVTRDPNFMVRYYLVRGILSLGGSARPMLEILANDSDPSIRRIASEQLIKLAGLQAR